ncbi:phage major tail tube protein [Veronia pacifica]|uniref:Phage tail protein n=1 Tax=Veronia pacifica TaxID=1080227 RepID=A0A1C3E526_9GAMM|nr:phage major tail tube protein [Veronia pacifica]ODA28348.1 hypothetical protein A8L45_23115 [Veronia pacifica]
MADRILVRQTALLDGLPMMNEIIEFTPPEITYKTADSEGSFVATDDTVGIEKLKWSLKVRGDHKKVSVSLAAFQMKPGQLNVDQKGKTTDGMLFHEAHSLFSKVTRVKKDAFKMGEKPSVTIEGVCTGYKLTDTGVLVHDINVDTGKTVVFGTDLMGEAGIL